MDLGVFHAINAQVNENDIIVTSIVTGIERKHIPKLKDKHHHNLKFRGNIRIHWNSI
jgi:hypothetical protein